MVQNKSFEAMLTVRDVSNMLHVHPNTIRRWSDQGMLKAYRINKRGDRRYYRHEIAKLVAEMSDSISRKNLFSDKEGT